VQISDRVLRKLLSRVQKPARYIGGEWNSVTKDWDAVPVRLALAYPDIYEIGMANLGLAILYELISALPHRLVERVYAPWIDMETVLRKEGVPLYSLETHHPIREFDVVGFTLQHELTYTNVLNMLDLSGIPLESSARTADMPLVIAGGSCSYNPEPMAAFIDAFVMGEGEEVLPEILDLVEEWKHTGRTSRYEILNALARIPGVYVPMLYEPIHGQDGTFIELRPTAEDIPKTIRKRIVPRLLPFPVRPILPHIQVVHDRAAIEIQRGCSRGCRFCQAGMIYRPVRERPLEEVLTQADELLANTGYDEVGLVSLSSTDHSQIKAIVNGLMERYADKPISISLPSLRIDSFSLELAQMIQRRRKTGLTFAPEAGSQRLRDVINKGVTEKDLLQTAEAAFSAGWNRIKLYFMLGLPTETDKDVLEIARLIGEIERLGSSIRQRKIDLNVSVATFVPKPHTPFQWEPLADADTIHHRQRLLAQRVHSKRIRLSYSSWKITWLEAILSRGDRALGAVIQGAWRRGAKFDAWNEHYKPQIWEEAFAEAGIDPSLYTQLPRPFDQALPWDHIDIGVTKAFLWRERELALQGIPSGDCRASCLGCGILSAFRYQREQVNQDTWGCP